MSTVLASDQGTSGTKAVVVDGDGNLVDQQAALIGEGCLRPGEAKCTFGTGAFLLANTGTTATRYSAGLAASVILAGPRRDDILRRRTGLHCLLGRSLDGTAGLHHHGRRHGQGPRRRRRGPGRAALTGFGAPWWRPEAKASVSGHTICCVERLSRFGHTEKLERSTGRFAPFAVAFAFVFIAARIFTAAATVPPRM